MRTLFMTGLVAVSLIGSLSACGQKTDDSVEASTTAATADIEAAGDAAAAKVDAAMAEAANAAALAASNTSMQNAQIMQAGPQDTGTVAP